jgi:hypothetical protein
LGYNGSTSNLEHACENLGGLGPPVWEEMGENAQTVHKPKLKFIYRLEKICNDLFEGQPLRMQFCSTKSQITCFCCFLTTIWKNFATALLNASCPRSYSEETCVCKINFSKTIVVVGSNHLDLVVATTSCCNDN